MTPQQAQQLAEKEYPFDRIERDSYLLWNEIKEREQAAFLNGLSKVHMWLKVEDSLPNKTGRYWVVVKNIYNDRPAGQKVARYDVMVQRWVKLSNSIVTHWMPIPELPNDQNTIV